MGYFQKLCRRLVNFLCIGCELILFQVFECLLWVKKDLKEKDATLQKEHFENTIREIFEVHSLENVHSICVNVIVRWFSGIFVSSDQHCTGWLRKVNVAFLPLKYSCSSVGRGELVIPPFLENTCSIFYDKKKIVRWERLIVKTDDKQVIFCRKCLRPSLLHLCRLGKIKFLHENTKV